MDPLRSAAQALLAQQAAADGGAGTTGQIDRASFEVRVGNDSELVSVRVRDGKLLTSCSCGAPACAHLRTTLELLAAETTALLIGADQSARSLAPGVGRKSLSPEPLGAAHVASDARPDVTRLAEALDDVVTAIVRKGVANPSGASVQDTLERLSLVLPSPPPVPLCRFVGRLRQALEARDVGACAQLLYAASQWVDDVRSGRSDDDARARASVWLDDARARQRVSDRVLLELARESVHGIERAQIERRYLVDLGSGEVLREERLRRAQDASIGPCPRLLGVGLAEVSAGSPRRVRLLQYTVSAEIDRASLRSLEGWALRDFAKITERFRAEMERFAGLHEPFVLVMPAGLARDALPGLVDEHGRVLGLHGEDDSGLLRRFEELTGKAPPTWVAGRLVHRMGHVMLRPLSLGILDGERLRHERL